MYDFSFNPTGILAACLTIVLLIVLAVYSFRRRSVPGALELATGAVLAAFWVASALMEYAAGSSPAHTFWLRLQVIVMLPAVSAVTCFIIEYTWPNECQKHRGLPLMAIAPLVAIVLTLTNHNHHLMWSRGVVGGSLDPVPGPTGLFFFTYAYLLGIVELVAFAWLFFRSPQHRWPVVVMLTGHVGARSIYMMEAFDLISVQLPIDVIVIGLLFIMYAIALFAFRIFDPTQLAQETVVEQLHAGMVVLDSEQKVASMNPAAERILQVSSGAAKGSQLRQLLPAYPDEAIDFSGTTTIELDINSEEGVRHFILSTSRLKDWRGQGVGYLLLMRDVTELRQARELEKQRQLLVAVMQERERLARELHDNLGQVFSFVNAQGQTVRRLLERGDIATADEYVSRLVDVAREADVDIRESILGLRMTLSDQGLIPALVQYTARYERNAGIHVDLVKPEILANITIEPLAEVQLLCILQEALANVRKHAQAECVWIAFGVETSFVQVTVIDDGKGFDPNLSGEAQDEHIGLRLMSDRAAEVGGSVQINSKPGLGTELVVRVPVKSESGTFEQESMDQRVAG